MKFSWLEIIGDALLIVFGLILIYIFVTIEILGYYGMEENSIIRWIELWIGIPIIMVGLNRLIKDVKK
mgnify:CR=1 FL=1